MKKNKLLFLNLLFLTFLLSSCSLQLGFSESEKESENSESSVISSESKNEESSSYISESSNSRTSESSSKESEESSSSKTNEESSSTKESEESSSKKNDDSSSSSSEESLNYSIKYYIDNSLVFEDNVKNGLIVSSLYTPNSKEHYSFNGWYLDSSLTKKFSTTKISSDIILYGTYVLDAFKVSYYVDDILYLTDTVSYSNKEVNPTNTPVKDGYLFVGWTESKGSNDLFNFDTEITKNLVLYAVFEKEKETTLSYAAYDEGIYATWSATSIKNTKVYYALYNESNLEYKEVDSELIRLVDTNKARVDIVGLAKGNYVIKVVKNSEETVVSNQISVTSLDRSGYAHFNQNLDSTGVDVSSGIGAYTNSGTLKENATVVYVTEDTKNTVSATIGNKTYTGLVNILQAKSKSENPLVIRIIGQISAATWNKIDYKETSTTHITPDKVIGANGKALELKNYTEEELVSLGYNTLDTSTYTKLNGLTNKIKYDSSKKEFDSYYNMCDISNAKNVTVEGIGTDAKIFQWGFTWKNCSSIEIRNLTFDDYTEDACSFEGSNDASTISGFKSGHIWIHNNTFNEGINYWDVCNEQDKHEGDGATDFKKNAYITVSYNHYYKNHKTGLVGGSDSQHTANITFHHNFYDSCSSRLPLARQANMHMYNNYYYNSGSYSMSLRANAYAFVEACYFENGQNPYELLSGDYGIGYAKVYNCEFKNVKINGSTYYSGNNVLSRTDTIDNLNVYSTTFDTDSTYFYYNEGVSDVSYITSATKAKEDCINYAGTLKELSTTNIYTDSTKEKYTITYSDGTNTIGSEIVENGNTISNIPSKDGYNTTLYTNSSFETLFDNSSVITSNLTLYVKYEKKDSSISLSYTLNASDLNPKENYNITTDTKYSTVFTLAQGLRVKKDPCFSGNKNDSYYKSESDYSNVIFVDVLDGYKGSLDITLASSESTRLIYLYNTSDMNTIIISGYSGTISANLKSGRYVIVFDTKAEAKISSLKLTLTK